MDLKHFNYAIKFSIHNYCNFKGIGLTIYIQSVITDSQEQYNNKSHMKFNAFRLKLMLETNRCNTYCHAGTTWVSNGSRGGYFNKSSLTTIEY